MAISDLKTKLIERIKSTSNILLLEKLNTIFESNTDAIYKLSYEQQNAINEAREDVANGRYSSNDEVQNKVNEWLKE